MSQDPQTPLGNAFTLLQNEESQKVVVLILKSITVPEWSALDNLLMEEAVVMKVKNKVTEVGKANIMTMDAHLKRKKDSGCSCGGTSPQKYTLLCTRESFGKREIGWDLVGHPGWYAHAHSTKLEKNSDTTPPSGSTTSNEGQIVNDEFSALCQSLHLLEGRPSITSYASSSDSVGHLDHISVTSYFNYLGSLAQSVTHMTDCVANGLFTQVAGEGSIDYPTFVFHSSCSSVST